MSKTEIKGKNSILVLDTSALLFDPACLTYYKDSTVVIPVSVLGELDKHKGRMDEVGANARYLNKTLHDLKERGNFIQGIKDPESNVKIKLKVENTEDVPKTLDSSKADNRILSVCFTLKKEYKSKKVFLITNDYNLSLLAAAYGVKSLEFRGDSVKVFGYKGHREIEIDEDFNINIDKLYKEKVVLAPANHTLNENEYCVIKNSAVSQGGQSVRCRYSQGKLHKLIDRSQASGIKPLNNEQAFVMDLLLNPDIKLVTISGLAGSGKAQPLTSKVLTKHGFVKMGSLKKGDLILTPSGHETKVLEIFPQGKKPIYKISFADGREVECCEDHLWPVIGMNVEDAEAIKVTSLKNLIQWRSKPHNRSRGRIPLVHFHQETFTRRVKEDTGFRIDPYTLGALIGDGSFRSRGTPYFSSKDVEVIDRISRELGETFEFRKTKHGKYDYRIVDLKEDRLKNGSRAPNRLTAELIRLDLHGKYSHEKHIPEEYFNSSLNENLEL
jgi:rRNA maturation endonuclease Nob1